MSSPVHTGTPSFRMCPAPHIRKVRQRMLSDFSVVRVHFRYCTRWRCCDHGASQPTPVPGAFRSHRTFPRPKNSPPDTFCTSLRTGAALLSPCRISEKSDSKCCRTFLAGALGLEPRAYGFGVDADKSASGGVIL